MKVIPSRLDGVCLIKPDVFKDARGFFLETYHQDRYREHGIDVDFVQDNFARSDRDVLRGMHYQIKRSQAKLIWVAQGDIFDVVVDVRKDSSTFGQWQGFPLSSKNHHQLFVPSGFAHGYCVKSRSACVIYKCSDFYFPENEAGLIWNDPAVGIEWPVEDPILSEKDQNLPNLENALIPDFS